MTNEQILDWCRKVVAAKGDADAIERVMDEGAELYGEVGGQELLDFMAAATVEKLEGQTVHVVMGNDYPDAVFAAEALAEAYCDAKRKAPDANHPGTTSPRIYWRVYPFELERGA